MKVFRFIGAPPRTAMHSCTRAGAGQDALLHQLFGEQQMAGYSNASNSRAAHRSPVMALPIARRMAGVGCKVMTVNSASRGNSSSCRQFECDSSGGTREYETRRSSALMSRCPRSKRLSGLSGGRTPDRRPFRRFRFRTIRMSARANALGHFTVELGIARGAPPVSEFADMAMGDCSARMGAAMVQLLRQLLLRRSAAGARSWVAAER